MWLIVIIHNYYNNYYNYPLLKFLIINIIYN